MVCFLGIMSFRAFQFVGAAVRFAVFSVSRVTG